jgi:hypothetical protein
MLRILLSRTALFPWLGIALMTTGAVFPEGNVVGMVLVVVGANVAFYSLRDFSQNFTWGAEARPLLALCGLLFLLGLTLVAGATLFDSLNRRLALLCTGGYLCLFAVWTAQQPVGWPYRILAVAGVLLMLLGGIVGYLGWQDGPLFAESEGAPQEIALIDLQRNGFGRNGYVRLKEFRFCDRSAAEKPEKQTKFTDLWIPVVAVDGQAVKKDGPAPPVPARIEAVAADLSLGNLGIARPRIGARNPRDLLRKKKEDEGYECTVVTGIKRLKPEVRQQLSALAPQTDFAEVVVLDWRKPRSAGRVYGCLAGGGAGLLLGLLALGLVYIRARSVVGVKGLEPPAEEGAEESVAVGQGQPGAEPDASPDRGGSS